MIGKHLYLHNAILIPNTDTVSSIKDFIFTWLIKTDLRMRYQFLSVIKNKQTEKF